MSKKILIIDSGMRNLGGHNYSYTRAVQSALEQKGFTVNVLVNKNLSADIAQATGYKPVFSVGAYDFVPGNGRVRDLVYLYAQSVIFSDELEAALKQAHDNYELVFCHTVNDFELIGWNRYLRKHKLPGRLMILLRHTPGFRNRNWLKLRAHPYWRIKPHYLKAIYSRLKDRFVLLTDSESLSADYAQIYKSGVVTLPIPVSEVLISSDESNRASANGILARYGLKREGKIAIGYMGDARPTKGFPLLPNLIERVLSDAGLNAKFVIQCPGSASGQENGQLPEGLAELKRLAQIEKDRVTLIYEKLSEQDYASLFGHLDVVLMPYLAANYAEATSGIFAEAMALSKPVVVPSQTWMASELRKSGGGVEFQRGNEDDLTAKVVHLVSHFDEYASKAKSFSHQWKSFHNSHTLTEILLKAGGLQPTYPTNRAQE